MIMVLSFFDFLVVITNHPIVILRLVWWLKEKNDLFAMLQIYEHFSKWFIGFSILALLVMSIERYLGAYYPFFHRTSLTRRRLLTLLAVLFLLTIPLAILSMNNLVISYGTVLVIFFLSVFPLLAFFNYKLFVISRRVRRVNTSSPDVSTLHLNLKNISTCLLTVACYFVTFLPAIFYISFDFAEKSTSENTRMALLWTNTVGCANSTLNCLIFFWKDDVLRREGIKTIKALKNRLMC
jgi:hypothetical protein